MKKAAFFNDNPGQIDRVYAKGRRERVAEITTLYPEVITSGNFEEHADKLSDLEVIFSTWGMWDIGGKLEWLPNLEAVFYAAGSVKRFAEPLLKEGLIVMSAWGANGVPVAEFTLAQILLACKGYFRNIADVRRNGGYQDAFRGRGVFGETVAVIGAGMIGRLLIDLLKPFELNLIVFDPYLPEEEAEKLGAEKVTLEEAFKRAYVITNHAPNVEETVGMIRREHFESMRDDATFINTGRGATIDEEGMIEVLRARPSLTALLDVTSPEPPEPGSPLYSLPNVRLSTHIAGSLGDEVVRMADYAIDEFLAWQEDRPLRFAISLEKLRIMA